MRTKQCSLLSKFLLGMSLAFSLSGCSSRFANLYVGYGITRTSYPKPTEQTCFHNHEIFLDEQGGLQRYAVRQIIENEQTPQETAQVMNNNAQQIFSYGNTKPAEAFYSHIEPKALGQFMLGCAKIAAQTGNHMRTLQASILEKWQSGRSTSIIHNHLNQHTSQTHRLEHVLLNMLTVTLPLIWR